jgi:hypothetical protein
LKTDKNLFKASRLKALLRNNSPVELGKEKINNKKTLRINKYPKINKINNSYNSQIFYRKIQNKKMGKCLKVDHK